VKMQSNFVYETKGRQINRMKNLYDNYNNTKIYDSTEKREGITDLNPPFALISEMTSGIFPS
jgi:hypothetical protein